ncbi:DUF2207 domain-containing protein [Roseibium litorale]|uniref:DUF2207 domain-containing protein n=1 Tax=Roseibium litorale TaxID=2803841 RepID=A0ABR9CS32_9HYPH|nr:DUF2207 domain-containing protein [Roseibium litorale]MBD8893066.1 DUF2207 domain-containing protein [Roseibium litorale]
MIRSSLPAFLFRVIFLPLLLGCFLQAAGAQERIVDFKSLIDIEKSGVVRVEETITVDAEGQRIERGIFRDIPTRFRDGEGRLHQTGIEVLAVKRDGKDENFRINRSTGGVRIYIGSPSVYLQPGRYTYSIVYETTRQIRFFDSHDEFYWNVTGNEWAFSIGHVTAEVRAPEGAAFVKWAAYTGAYGATGSDFTVRQEDIGNGLLFRTTRLLGPTEGLTIVAALPAGTVEKPGLSESAGYFLADYTVQLAALGGLLAAFLYYVFAWMKVGRDPKAGVIFPRFEPPAGVSPALAHFIYHRGFSAGGWIAVAAASLSLAIKGVIKLQDLNGDLKLTKTGKKVANLLPKGEAVIDQWLTDQGGEALICDSNSQAVSSLGSEFCSAISTENKDRYFLSNWRWILPGVGISFVTLIALAFSGALAEYHFVFIFVISIFTAVISVIARSLPDKTQVWVILGFSFVLIFSLLAVLSSFSSDSAPLVFAVLVALASLTLIFAVLLATPTAHGRQVLDEIEGLEMYLSVAEAERMNMQGASLMNQAHFEALLPYAVALGVEKPWSKAFEAWMKTAAGANDPSYDPYWYSGQHFSGSGFASSLSSTVSSLSGTFSSSLPETDSSSSGFSSGGGSSGGGGGGGGGGGW